VIAVRKHKNAPHSRTSQVSKKWVRTRTSQLATAHRNLLSHIAIHALENTPEFICSICLPKPKCSGFQ
jgi:hypothetical protein